MAKNDELTLDTIRAEAPEGGVLVTSQEALYSSDLAKDKDGKIIPVVGWLVGVEQIKSPKPGYDEKIFLRVDITQPTVCHVGGKPFVLKQGVALVACSKALEGWEEKATHESLASKVVIQFLTKDKQANGNDFWSVQVRVLEVRSRSELATESLEGMQKALAEAQSTKQIAASAS